MKIFATIVKRDDEKRMVFGYASTEAMDSQGEKVSKAAIEKALPDYMRWANVREMHQASAVGVTKSAEMSEKGLYIQAKIVDDDAWRKVKEEVYKGFSIGGKSVTKSDDTITELKLTEISLVDRPANPECEIELWKMDGDKPAAVPVEKSAVEQLGELVNAGKISPAELLELAKRQFSDKQRQEMADKGHALPDGSFPIATVGDLKNAIKAFGRAKDKAKAKAHIIARAKALKATDELPADWRGSTKDDGKAEGAGDVRKGMYQVAWLANLIDTIACLQRENAFEQAAEADPDSQCPAMLKEWLDQGCKILAAMCDEEASELMGVSGIEVVESAARAEGLEKSGAKFSTATKAKLAEAHDHIKKAAGHMEKAKAAPMGEAHAHMEKCEKCIGKADAAMGEVGYDGPSPRAGAKADDNSDESSAGGKDQKSKAEESSALAAALTPPAAGTEILLKAELDKRDATITALEKRLKALEDQPQPAKGPIRVVAKTDDEGTGKDPAPAIQPVRNADGTVDQAATDMKKAQAIPMPMRHASVYFQPRPLR